MAVRKKGLSPVEIQAQRLLADAVSASSLSQKEIGQAVGISQNRVGIILRRETPPATIGELLSIASVVGADGVESISKATQADAASNGDSEGA